MKFPLGPASSTGVAESIATCNASNYGNKELRILPIALLFGSKISHFLKLARRGYDLHNCEHANQKFTRKQWKMDYENHIVDGNNEKHV